MSLNLRVMTSLLGLSLPVLAATAQPSDRASGSASYLASPIRFEANKGQAPQSVDYISLGTQHSLYLQKTGIRLDVPGIKQPESIVLTYVNPQSTHQGEGLSQVGSKSAYLVGSDPNRWFFGLSSYGRVRYNQIWRGIDVVYYGNHSQLEYDVVVGPGAGVEQAKFQIAGARGLAVNPAGDLLIETASGVMLQHRPVAYQNTAAGRREVQARYAVAGNTVSFQVGQYDRSAELIIDPVIAFSIPRVLGAPTVQGTGVAVDTAGFSWVTGNTLPVNTNPNIPTSAFTTVFVNQIDANGNETGEHVTVGASDGNTTAGGIATDNAGSIYITGTTASVFGFPLKNQYQTTSGGGSDAFLIRLNLSLSSSIVYSTYLGGSGNDYGNAVAVDSTGNAYVAGQMTSANFPQTLGSPYAGSFDAYVAKINTNASGASSLVYSYVTGGAGSDAALGVALDSNGNLYVAGNSASTTFLPNPNFGFVTNNPAGNANGFVLKLNSATGAASYLTFFVNGPLSSIAADSAQQAYVTGQSNGSIPTNSVNQGYGLSGGSGHSFVARFSTTVTGVGSMIYSSYLAGGGTDYGAGIGVDGSGNATVAGWTTSSNFPVAGTPLASTLGGSQDATISKINTNGSGTASLVYSTYLGGSGADAANAVGLNRWGNPVVTGYTASPDFPVTPSAKPDGGTDQRAFVTKLLYEAPPFGSLDTPRLPPTTNAAGALNVTGWALSTIAISNIGIWRNPVNGEPTAGNGLVFISNAEQIAGARPDVAMAYPGYPNNNWGWGVQVLTNELPGVGTLALGNGTYTFHALATDNEGLTAEIGTTTITVNNAASTVPFGTIDTPSQGGTESGSFYNFGWALTPLPGTIPVDGSTIVVYIDNIPVGHPTYNQYRPDIATLFPGYNNSQGAVGFYLVDTTKLTNGIHTIQWSVTDNKGRASGLGSRYFIVAN